MRNSTVDRNRALPKLVSLDQSQNARAALRQEELEQRMSSIEVRSPDAAETLRDLATEILKLEKDPEAYFAAEDALELWREILVHEPAESPLQSLAQILVYPALAKSTLGIDILNQELRDIFGTDQPKFTETDRAISLAKALGQTAEGCMLLLKNLELLPESASEAIVTGLAENPEALPDLQRLLRGTKSVHRTYDADVRQRALITRALTGNSKALEDLQWSAKHTSTVLAVAGCLSIKGKEEAQDTLIEVLESRHLKNDHVADAAIAALEGQKLSASSKRALVQVYRESNSSKRRHQILELLRGTPEIEGVATQLLRSPSARDKSALCLSLLGTKDQEAIEVLLGYARLQDGTELCHAEATVALGLRAETKESLLRIIDSAHIELAKVCAVQLQSAKDKETILALVDGLRTAKRTHHYSIALKGNPAAEPYLAELIGDRNLQDPSSKIMAVEALEGTEGGQKILLNLLAELQPDEQARVIYFLKKSPAAVAKVSQLLKSEESSVRASAAEFLGECGEKLELLEGLLDDDSSFVRLTAAKYLRENETATRLLLENVLDQNRIFLGNDANYLCKRPHSVTVLRQLLETYHDRQVGH